MDELSIKDYQGLFFFYYSPQIIYITGGKIQSFGGPSTFLSKLLNSLKKQKKLIPHPLNNNDCKKIHTTEDKEKIAKKRKCRYDSIQRITPHTLDIKVRWPL